MEYPKIPVQNTIAERNEMNSPKRKENGSNFKITWLPAFIVPFSSAVDKYAVFGVTESPSEGEEFVYNFQPG